MKIVFGLLLLVISHTSVAVEHLLIIQGAAGESKYREGFTAAAEQWLELANESGADATMINGASSKERINDWLKSTDHTQAESIWIIYIGHGSYSGAEAKLNLSGSDLSATELATWLEPISNELVFIHGGAASSPFIREISGPNRVVISATRSGNEGNYARFGEHFVEAMANSSSDIDLDGSVSLLEAFISASSAVESYYLEAGRLSTEHALLDDNGDSKGTPANRFDGLRLQSDEKLSSSEGLLAKRLTLSSRQGSSTLTPHQVAERNRLEQELNNLYLKKQDIQQEAYFTELEMILNKLASIYLKDSDS